MSDIRTNRTLTYASTILKITRSAYKILNITLRVYKEPNLVCLSKRNWFSLEVSYVLERSEERRKNGARTEPCPVAVVSTIRLRFTAPLQLIFFKRTFWSTLFAYKLFLLR